VKSNQPTFPAFSLFLRCLVVHFSSAEFWFKFQAGFPWSEGRSPVGDALATHWREATFIESGRPVAPLGGSRPGSSPLRMPAGSSLVRDGVRLFREGERPREP